MCILQQSSRLKLSLSSSAIRTWTDFNASATPGVLQYKYAWELGEGAKPLSSIMFFDWHDQVLVSLLLKLWAYSY